VVDHDPVLVVDDLGFVAELDRLAEAALADGTGVGVVQRHQPGRPVRGGAVDALTGLAAICSTLDAVSSRSSAMRHELSRCGITELAQRAPGIGGHPAGLFDRGRCNGGHLGVDGQHLVFGLAVRRRRLAPMERARERIIRVRSREVVLVARPLAWSDLMALAIFATPLANRPESVG
jgi:hypothetical protein